VASPDTPAPAAPSPDAAVAAAPLPRRLLWELTQLVNVALTHAV
jgi:hypothetical protein